MGVNSPNDYFREFVDTLAAAIRKEDPAESPVMHIHPVLVRDGSPHEPHAQDSP
jgi:hypothetical protein